MVVFAPEDLELSAVEFDAHAPVGQALAGTGNGTVHGALESALLEAQRAGVGVLRATRCATGRVLATPADMVSDSQGLSPVKARIALALALMR